MNAKEKTDRFLDALKGAEKEKPALLSAITAAKMESYARQEKIRERWVAEGLVYAKKIFAWAKQLKNSAVGKRLLELTRDDRPDKNSVVFFTVKGRRFDIPNLCVAEYGIVCYCGHDYRGRYIEHLIADSPDALAIWCDPAVLRRAWEAIGTGEVYETMQARVDHLISGLRFSAKQAQDENKSA